MTRVITTSFRAHSLAVRTLLAAATILAIPSDAVLAQARGSAAAARYPERAVRRDIPITNAIRRALVAGSRDSTGRANRQYWQLRTDYVIAVTLDVPASRLTGRETITITNNSPDALQTIRMRLDANHFIGTVPRAATWVPAENTEGLMITRMTVDGKPVNLAPAAGGGGRGGGRGGPPAAPSEHTLGAGKTTNAPIAQLDRASVYGTEGCRFDSCWVYLKNKGF